MSKFATKKIAAVNSRECVEELYIEGRSIMQTFEEKLTSAQYKSEFKTILKYIEYAANGHTLPKTKFRPLKGRPKSDKIPDFEFKSEHLRIYGIQMPNKKLILLCGYKNSQDIDSFRYLKYQYLNSLNSKK